MIPPPLEAQVPDPAHEYPGKRLSDIIIAGLMLLVASPIMLLLAAVVKLTSRGPVFYFGSRIGKGGRPFRQIKFRSMTTKTPGGAFTGKNDPRVTPIGRLIRLIKLDELPQLLNVLRGEMSIVGPRPEDSAVVSACYAGEQLEVLSIRPGLTCLTQVRHFPDLGREIPDHMDPEQYYRAVLLPMRLAEDLEYVRTMSPALDAKLILATAYCMLVKSWWPLSIEGKGPRPQQGGT